MINNAIQPLTTTDADVLEDLDDIEHMALELATLAGAEIVTTYGGIFAVRYKTGAAGALSSLRDPVSEIDHRVETLIRARLAERFPGPDVIGEGIQGASRPGPDFAWAVRPPAG